VKNVKYLIFDLDDTLFDYRKAAKEAMSEVYKKTSSKHNVELQRLEENYNEILKEIDVHGFQDGRKSTDYRRERFERLLASFNIMDNELVEMLLNTYHENLVKSIVLFSETKDVLEKLSSRYVLILATQGPSDAQNLSIDMLGIRKYFTRIFISGEIGGKKGDGSMFNRVIDDLKARPEEAIVIGDSIKNDVLGAKIASMDAIWVNRRNEINSLNVTEVKDLNGLVDVL